MKTSIAAKLYLGFGLMAALIVAGALFILHSIDKASLNYENLTHHTKGAVLLARGQSALWQLRWDLAQFMVIDSPTRSSILVDDVKWTKVVQDVLDSYGALDISAEEKRTLAELRDAYRKYAEARPAWFELFGSGKTREAADWRARTTTPYGIATVKAFDELIALQQKSATADQQRIATDAQSPRNVVFAFVALSLGIAMIIAFLIARSIIAPMKQLVAITDGISKG